jgi:hypothetical protein
MTSKGAIKLVGIVLGLIVVLLMGWVGYRLWIFNQEAPFRAGISAFKEGDYKLALTKLKPYADSGDPLAQLVIGDMYAEGLGVPYDEVQASIWYRRAECGRKDKLTGRAEYGKALRYLSNESWHDATKAARWLQRAAEAGHPEAQRLLSDEKQLAQKGLKIDPAVSEYWRKYASPTP